MGQNEIRTTIVIPSQDLKSINKYLTATKKEDFLSEDETISFTAIFPDGKQMDIKCCGSQDESAWAEAVLFNESGHELCHTECYNIITGEWCLEYGDTAYITTVIGSDDVIQDTFFQTFLLPDKDLKHMELFLFPKKMDLPETDLSNLSIGYTTTFPDNSTVTIGCFGQDHDHARAKGIWKSGVTGEEVEIYRNALCGFWCFDVGTRYTVFVSPYDINLDSIRRKDITISKDMSENATLITCRYGKVSWQKADGHSDDAEFYIPEPLCEEDDPTEAYLICPATACGTPASPIKDYKIKFSHLSRKEGNSVVQENYEILLPRELFFPAYFNLYVHR